MATPQLSINRDDLRARALAATAGVQQARARAVESRAGLRRHVEASAGSPDLPTAQRVRIGYWRAVRAGIGALLTVPGMLVGGLDGMSRVADDMSSRGAQLAERGRTLAGRIPPSRAERRRGLLRILAWAAGAFAAGFVTGWVVATRIEPVPDYDPYDDLTEPLTEPLADPRDDGDGPDSNGNLT